MAAAGGARLPAHVTGTGRVSNDTLRTTEQGAIRDRASGFNEWAGGRFRLTENERTAGYGAEQTTRPPSEISAALGGPGRTGATPASSPDADGGLVSVRSVTAGELLAGLWGRRA
ncbi:hypothetical protein SRHO_G00033120 [Serrasalmus rhombeus]